MKSNGHQVDVVGRAVADDLDDVEVEQRRQQLPSLALLGHASGTVGEAEGRVGFGVSVCVSVCVTVVVDLGSLL
jgi:hypothetical protein